MKQNNLNETIEMLIVSALANTHTLLPAKVTIVNQTTINCQPTVNRIVNGKSIKLPELINVPPVFLSGGDSYISMPIKKNDYVLLAISERCYDAWYNGQDFVSPPQSRMHNYSDAFAIAGIKNMRGAIAIPDKIKFKGDALQEGNYTHTGNITRTGDTTLNGNFTQTGSFDLTGDMTVTGNLTINGNVSFSGTLSIGGLPGASGVFTSQDGKIVTVTSGLVTSIT
jgi:hypothetical protein